MPHPGRIALLRVLLRFGAVPTLLTMLAPGIRAQQSDSTGEFWPEVDVYLNLNQNSRLFAMYSATRPENLRTYADGQVGLHMDIYGLRPLRERVFNYNDAARAKPLMVRVGYLYSHPKNDSGAATEHTATAEGTGRAHLPGNLLLSDRNRLDLRWNNGNPRHRYRNRLKLEHSFKRARFEFTPYGHAEVFYDLRTRVWSRFRFAVGSEWAITKRIVFEAYFLRQNTWSSVPQFVNAVGLAVQFYAP